MKTAAISVLIAVGLFFSAAAEADDDIPRPSSPGQGLTIYHDVNPMPRTSRAARAMTALHADHFEHGWQVIDVDAYVEDGDLKGFFITYIARDDSALTD